MTIRVNKKCAELLNFIIIIVQSFPRSLNILIFIKNYTVRSFNISFANFVAKF